jgi:hypothetical protein
MTPSACATSKTNGGGLSATGDPSDTFTLRWIALTRVSRVGRPISSTSTADGLDTIGVDWTGPSGSGQSGGSPVASTDGSG